MLNNLTNFFNLIRGRKIKKTLANSDLIAIGVRDDRFDGNYQPSAIKYEDLQTQVGVPYKSYVAHLIQSGTNAPTPFVLENSLGVDVTFQRVVAGQYIMLFSEPVFTSPTSAFVTVSQLYDYDIPSGNGYRIGYGISFFNVITIESFDLLTATYNDDILGQAIVPCIIEVRIYN